jgi:hypothetical protein
VGKSRGPLDQRSDAALKKGLAEGEYAPRKKAFVHEILRRRRAAKAEGRSRTYVWLGAIVAAFSFIAALKRMWRT